MKQILFIAFAALFSWGSVFAQQTVSGTVTDTDGEALIGATIMVQGTTTGTISDFDGNFSVQASGDDVLVISYTGYLTQEVNIDGRSNIDIVMEIDAIGLDQVVVLGYLPQRRADITGAVSSVSSEDFIAESNVGVQTALRGRTAGVTVTQSSGTPGGGVDVRVRGSTSITASNQPLYVIDGVPVVSGSFSQVGVGNQGVNALADLNPADIESIEVLKDALSASIYGSRGANGVVLITTKRGRAGVSNIDLNIAYGFQETPSTINMVDSAGYRDYLGEAYGNRNFLAGALDGNSDWQDLIFRTGNTADINLSFSGGTEATRYFASLTYHDNEGIITGSRYQRYSGRLNLEHFASDRFSFGMNMGYTHSINDRIQNDNNIFGALSTAILLPPTVPVFNADGTYGSALGLENPVAAANEYANQITSNRVIGNFFGRYEIIDGLSYRASVGIDLLSFRELIYQPSVLQSSTNGIAQQGTTDNLRWLLEHTLTLQRRIGDFSLDAVAGLAFQEEARNTSFVQVNDFPTDNFRGLSAGASPTEVAGGFTGDNLRSYFFNANLNYMNRFILSGVIRADGSSKFINDQWGYFPGAALAWRLTEEDFLSGLRNNFDEIKLRVSYGQTGNNAIGNFLARPLFGGGANYITAPGIAPTQIGNPDLVWETTTQINVGLDFSTANQRISGSIDYYIKETEDLLLGRPIPTTSGFATVIQNIGDMENEGVELSLTTRNFVGDFDWSTTFNIAYNKNTVVRLFDNQPIASGFANRIEEGQPLGSFYGYATDGIFQNAAEVEAHASQANAAPGDIRFKDLNGDGVINDQDRTFLGKGIPDLTGGLTSNMRYKGFSLDLFFQFAAGFEIYNNNRAFTEGLNSVFAPTKSSFDRAWRQEGDVTDVPRIVAGDPANNRRTSDRFVESGDYMKLKTATLSYTLPTSVVNNIGLRSARIYVSGTNLFTITDYTGFDPEVNTFDGSNISVGTDFLTYPQPRSIVFGVNLGF